MRKIILFIFFITSIFAQAVCSDSDQILIKQKLKDFSSKQNLPIGELVSQIGKTFIGTEYQSHTLRNIEKEELKINLSGVDCYTFVETALALARLIKRGDTTFIEFAEEIEKLRYRDGKLNGYTSRLHYFSDWLFEMDKSAIINLITEKIGGEKYEKQINFMSKNYKYYPELVKHKELIEEIKLIENDINSRTYFYIPQNKICEVSSKLESGDIVGFTTGIGGLDISHVGIIIERGNKNYLLHAPNEGQKVQITEKSISDYVISLKRHTGIMIARPILK